jgi:hypothetical protein
VGWYVGGEGIFGLYIGDNSIAHIISCAYWYHDDNVILCRRFVGQKRGKRVSYFSKQKAASASAFFCLTNPALEPPELDHNKMLDAVSLMPKRSINNTGAKVYKSDTTCWRKFIPRYFPTINTRFLQTCSLPLRTPNPFLCNDPHHHVYSTQQQMTRQ